MQLKKFWIILFCLFMQNIFAVSNAAVTTPHLQKLTVILDWFVNPDHAPLFVAQQQGFYQQQGLQVNFIAPADPSDPPKLVAAGKADIAVDYQPHLLMEIAQGLPLVQIGTLVATPLDCLAVLADGPIHSIGDLKGKKIGYSVPGIDNAMINSMLMQHGLTLKDVQLINVHYALSQALLSKQVDAVTGMMRNFDVIQLQLAGHPARTFYPEDNGMPPYDELVLITSRDKQNDPRIQKFLTAVELGAQYLVNHPDTTWTAFAKAHPELNNELNHRAWIATLPRFALRPAAVDPQRCERLANYLNTTLNLKISPQACMPTICAKS